MARSYTRYSVYPASRAIEVVGSTSPELNQAIECWATLLIRAIAENSRVFSEDYNYSHLTSTPKNYYPLHDWGMIAEGLRNIRIDPEFPNPGALLASAIQDAETLQSISNQWFNSEGWEDSPDQFDGLHKKTVAAMIKKIHDLDYAHAWALLLAVRWFWAHQAEGMDIRKDKWWTWAFRQEHEAKERGGPASADSGKKLRKRRDRKVAPAKNA